VSGGDSATVSVFVRVSQSDAFDVFTREIDQWWRQGPRYRMGGRQRGELFFECHLGGRLFESFDEGHRTVQVGKVTHWDPPRSLVLEWRGVNFAPHESTTVAVTFEPSGDGTLVTVKHSGWSSLPADHPARHGLVGGPFVRKIGAWWGDLMSAMREHVAERVAPTP